FKPLLERAGLPSIRFHDLRHSAASILLEMGVHPKIVAEMLGHSQISITMDIYSHAIPGLQKVAVEKMGEALFGRRAESETATEERTWKRPQRRVSRLISHHGSRRLI